MSTFELKPLDELQSMTSREIAAYIEVFEDWKHQTGKLLDGLYAKAYNKERQEYLKQLNLSE